MSHKLKTNPEKYGDLAWDFLSGCSVFHESNDSLLHSLMPKQNLTSKNCLQFRTNLKKSQFRSTKG